MPHRQLRTRWGPALVEAGHGYLEVMWPQMVSEATEWVRALRQSDLWETHFSFWRNGHQEADRESAMGGNKEGTLSERVGGYST